MEALSPDGGLGSLGRKDLPGFRGCRVLGFRDGVIKTFLVLGNVHPRAHRDALCRSATRMAIRTAGSWLHVLDRLAQVYQVRTQGT